ncbi:Bifunctional transcriptional activator/DNA repair enzyme AdaA [Octadecabacter temperatus]|uniref:Bifunctional transcriptional activator/DNA repair enzyme AdaA n=1 Tax=Octadecabacter temperatus TaxID=1458307 RepID=A0A0K0Y2K3_9RHOB|nr:Bifunctional transcriptional activator/DNA repair enzyme AdaA [Octadecabacter temperatus]
MNKKQNTRNDHISRVNRVTDYVRKNLNQDLSLKCLSKIAALSKFHFHRVFSETYGETPSAYVKRIRIESSAFLLIFDPKKSVNITRL